jgi:DNA-binding CsgD family transcriptional regulator
MNAPTIDQAIKNANIYLAVKDARGRFSYCNEKFAELLDADSPSSIYKKDDFQFFTSDAAKFYQQGDASVLQGAVFNNHAEIISKINDTSFKSLVSKNIFRSSSGEPKGVVISFIENIDSQEQNTLHLNYCAQYSRYYFPLPLTDYFTKREYNVFCCLFNGTFSAKQIAKTLCISYRTVEHHLINIQRKLQCSNKYDIVSQAMLLGLIH